jgi:hypothetical protein
LKRLRVIGKSLDGRLLTRRQAVFAHHVKWCMVD